MKTWKILLVSLFLLLCVSSAVAEGIVTPMFVNIRSTQASLSISGSTASCIGGVWAYSSSSSCSMTMRLQKQNGSSWSTLVSWTSIGSGSATRSETYTITAGTYRVNVSGYVDDEYYSATSSTQTKY